MSGSPLRLLFLPQTCKKHLGYFWFPKKFRGRKTKVPFRTQKVLGEEENTEENDFFYGWFHHGKYKKKSNIIKIP